MVLGPVLDIYSDEIISASELNRRPGYALDQALDHPITITRNDHAFALLRREDARNLVKAQSITSLVLEVIATACQICLGKKVEPVHPYGWLNEFDVEDLQQLVEEVLSTFRSVGSDPDQWNRVETVIHEWHESALASASSELSYAFADQEEEELPLTKPTIRSADTIDVQINVNE